VTIRNVIEILLIILLGLLIVGLIVPPIIKVVALINLQQDKQDREEDWVDVCGGPNTPPCKPSPRPKTHSPEAKPLYTQRPTADEIDRAKKAIKVVDQLIKPTWNDGPPEPYFKPKPLTPQRIQWLRSMNYLPPEEFDHEYKGELKVVRGTQQQLRAYCPGSFNPGWNAIGCAKPDFGGATCIIYILNDQGLQAIGWDLEIVLRHERAHCNGWSHPR
jgi:hypothetical protein